MSKGEVRNASARTRRDAPPGALERLVLFSDAVFAIAITLLVVEIDVPTRSDGDLASALADLWPQFLSFLLSFLVVGLFWIGHHRMFGYVARSDSRLLWLNLALLLCIAFLPFPTALLGEHEGDRVAVLFYASAMTATGLASASLWRYASAGGRLLASDADEAIVRYLSRRSVVVPLSFLPSLPVAFVSARAAEALWFLAFPLVAVVRRVHRQAF